MRPVRATTAVGIVRRDPVGRAATSTDALSVTVGAVLIGTQKRAPERPLHVALCAVVYGQEPVTMSEPGPVFFQVSAPTVLSRQYVVLETDWTMMFLTPWS